jgi:enediyne biosynthesis protein E4
MLMIKRYLFVLLSILSSLFFAGCTSKSKPQVAAMFTTLEHDKTGLDFDNTLTPSDNFNMFNYMYFYNGSGVGAGDFNNDGLIDLFFASNQQDNKLFLNEGKLHFKEATAQANIPQDHGWSTGVSVVDINNDGLLDIYVCKVGSLGVVKNTNQLLVCKGIKNGIPYYEDQAKQYGLAFSGLSTQAAFLDYDGDGYLDMYLLNHTLHQNGSFAPRSKFIGTYDSLYGNRLFHNDGNHFSDATKQSNINSSAIGYGLGIAVADVNLDGWPDIYIGNDFHENDYLYINQRNGTFADENTLRLMHTSKFSMGVDIADANNDGYPEIITTDMLASDPHILKRSLGDDDYDIFYDKISFGYSYQYSRNNLQYNRRNDMFSEVGLYAGVSATDWSWAPLWMDFDNDGLKDLFISNGIPKRLNDIDYVNFIYNREIQKKIGNNTSDDDVSLIKKYPEIKIPNKFFRNNANLHFTDISDAVENSLPVYSNGSVYADLDNDGDLDVVVNNINDFVLVYENKLSPPKAAQGLSVRLQGSEKNKNAIGARIVLFSGDSINTYENNTVRGFMSSMMEPMHVGLGGTPYDSAFLIWPDRSFQRIDLKPPQRQVTFIYSAGLPAFNYNIITGFHKHESLPVTDVARDVQLNDMHHENNFNEFDREPLMTHMLSCEGPALAVADINHDGLDDVFIGAAKTYYSGIFLQQKNGKFIKTIPDCIKLDSLYEDTDATWADVNNDGNLDLIVASGGNEYYGTDEHLLPRVYLNDGKANFTKSQNAFTNVLATASCIAACDFNGDGFTDLFLGARAVPWNYGEIPTSYLLQNDGKGKFIDVTERYAKGLSKAGLVTSALWLDLDKDGDNDLVITYEWGGIIAYINNKGSFSKTALTESKGWWSFLLPVDIDGDGDMDFVAGNLGLNSRLHATSAEPVRLYFNDFDDNGKNEQVITYYLGGKEITFATKDELQKRMPPLKKKYIYAEDFANASLTDIFSSDKLKHASLLSADYFNNVMLINDGNLHFSLSSLPWEAQLTSYKTAVVVNANNDSLPDILLGGNYYENNIASGRYDADFGTLLINKGNGKIVCGSLNGMVIKGEVRHIKPLQIKGVPSFIVAKNNDTAMVLQFRPGL